MSFATGFLWAMQERENYSNWLEAERQNRQPASLTGNDKCVRCGFCCATRTCVPLPSELPQIAEYLNLTAQELIKKYMVGDEMIGHRFLRFANTAQTDILGEFLSDSRTYDKGQCLLYDEQEKACQIWVVRPQDACEHQCWNDNEDGHKSMEQWKGGQLKKLCPDMAFDDYEDEDDSWD